MMDGSRSIIARHTRLARHGSAMGHHHHVELLLRDGMVGAQEKCAGRLYGKILASGAKSRTPLDPVPCLPAASPRSPPADAQASWSTVTCWWRQSMVPGPSARQASLCIQRTHNDQPPTFDGFVQRGESRPRGGLPLTDM